VSDDAGSTQYKPEPLDTSAVLLSEEQTQLREILAEKVHDNWAATRFAAGWSPGPHIDDDKKTHPCLVPYAELSEEDKNIDRNVVVTIFYEMRKRGYRVLPPGATDKQAID
jgi:RyR domain